MKCTHSQSCIYQDTDKFDTVFNQFNPHSANISNMDLDRLMASLGSGDSEKLKHIMNHTCINLICVYSYSSTGDGDAGTGGSGDPAVITLTGKGKGKSKGRGRATGRGTGKDDPGMQAIRDINYTYIHMWLHIYM